MLLFHSRHPPPLVISCGPHRSLRRQVLSSQFTGKDTVSGREFIYLEVTKIRQVRGKAEK